MDKVAKLILLLAFAMASAGCVGAQETDQVAYILTVGLDKAQEEGKLEITYQVAIPRALSGSEGAKGGGGGEQTYNVSVTVSSTAEGINQLNSILSRTPNLSHNKAFLIGEKLAREGLMDVIAPLLRYREWRGTMFIFVVQGDTAKRFMQKNQPKLESLSRYYESMSESGKDGGYYIVPNLHQFYIRLKDGSAAPYAALCGIHKVEGGAPTEGKNPPRTTEEYEDGSLPQNVTDNSTPVAIMGTALFRGDKMVGTLTSEETRMLAMILGDFRHGFLTVEDPLLTEKNINVNLRLGRSTKLTVDFIDGRPVLGVDAFLEGEITSIPSGINYEQDQYYQLLEEQIAIAVKQDMLKMIRKTQRLGCDTAGFGYVARTRWRTYDEYKKADWARLYSEADVHVKVAAKLRRMGLMWQTAPLVGDSR